jgi:hypothetical protein
VQAAGKQGERRDNGGFMAAVVLSLVLAVGAGVLLSNRAETDPPTEVASAPGPAPTPDAGAEGDVDPSDGHGSAVGAGPEEEVEIPPQVDLASAPVKGERAERIEPEVQDGVKDFTLSAEPEPGGLMNFVTYQGYDNAYQRDQAQ